MPPPHQPTKQSYLLAYNTHPHIPPPKPIVDVVIFKPHPKFFNLEHTSLQQTTIESQDELLKILYLTHNGPLYF